MIWNYKGANIYEYFKMDSKSIFKVIDIHRYHFICNY